MSNNNTVENKSAASEKPLKTKSTAKKNIFSKPILIIVILATLLIALSYGTFHFYIENKKQMAEQKIEMSLLSKKLEDVLVKQVQTQNGSALLEKGVTNQLGLVNSELQKVQNENKINKTDVQSLQRSLAATYIRQPNDWILSEVDYLVKLAGRKIWLEQDIKTAIALLIAADQRVVELNDHSLSGLRSALLEDINMLSALPTRNPDSVILKLSSLELRVGGLKTDAVIMPDPKDNSKTAISNDVNDWKANLNKSWTTFLEGFVVVNKRDERVEALLLPEQVWYLKANLRAELAKAEFAIYREQQEIYDIAMADIKNTLKHYFVVNDPATKSFKNSINRLSKRKVTIVYPEQLKTTALLNRVMDLRVKKVLESQLTTTKK